MDLFGAWVRQAAVVSPVKQVKANSYSRITGGWEMNDHPNKGYDKLHLETMLRALITGQTSYYLAQYGNREWIADAVDAVASSITDQIRSYKDQPQ
jgi:hypothetical protein